MNTKENCISLYYKPAVYKVCALLGGRYYGIKVIRISNLYINKNFEGICMLIDNEVKQSLNQLR